MNEIQNINGENKIVQTIPSTEVAKMMDRPHAKVLVMLEGSEKPKVIGIIPTLLRDASSSVSDYFIESSYKVPGNNKTYKCYECTKMGCELLANKMTGERGILFTAKYVKRFNEMEQYIKEQNTPSYMIENPVERAKRWILEYQEKEKLQIENQQQTQAIEEMTPKADYFDALVDNNLLTNIRDTAKQLHIKQTAFTKWLIENNFCYRDVRGKIKPYADKMEYFELKEFTTDWGHSDTQTLITPRGKEAFRLLLSKELQKKNVKSKKKGLKKRAK